MPHDPRRKEEDWKRRFYRSGVAAPLAALGGRAWYEGTPQLAIAPVQAASRGEPPIDSQGWQKLTEQAGLNPPLTWMPGWGGETHFPTQGDPSVLLGRESPSWVAAHELGHVQAIDKHPTLGRLGLSMYNTSLPMLGAAGTALMPTQRAGRLAAILGTLASVPTLGTELSASHYGGKLLAQQSGHWQDYLKAYGGVPTYLAAALAPVAAYQAAKLLRRWEPEEEAKPSGMPSDKDSSSKLLKRSQDDWCDLLMEKQAVSAWRTVKGLQSLAKRFTPELFDASKTTLGSRAGLLESFRPLMHEGQFSAPMLANRGLGGAALPKLSETMQSGMNKLRWHEVGKPYFTTSAGTNSELGLLNRIQGSARGPTTLYRGMAYPTPYRNGYQVSGAINSNAVHGTPWESASQIYRGQLPGGYGLGGRYRATPQQMYYPDYGLESAKAGRRMPDVKSYAQTRHGEMLAAGDSASDARLGQITQLKQQSYETPITNQNKFLGYDIYNPRGEVARVPRGSTMERAMESGYAPVPNPTFDPTVFAKNGQDDWCARLIRQQHIWARS